MPAIGRFCFPRSAVLTAALVVFSAGNFLLAQTSPAGSFESLAAKAAAARDAGNPEEAVRNYRAALELRPMWDEGWWYLGTILYDADHFDEAIPALRRVVEMHPTAGPALAFLGLSEFETGDYGSAYAHLLSARQNGFAESPEVEKVALYHLALLSNLQRQFESTTETLAASFGPSHYTDQIRVAMGLALLRVPLLPAQVDPGRDALIHAAGEAAVLAANHQSEAAARSLEQILRDYPDTPYLHYQYALQLEAGGHFPEAEREFRLEAQVSPQSALPWIALAEMFLRRQNAELAVRSAQKAVDAGPRSPAAQRVLAKSLRAAKSVEAAVAAEQHARDLAQAGNEPDAAPSALYVLNRGAAVAKPASGGAPPRETPGNFEELARQAENERRAGRLDEAAATYRQALALRSTWPEGWRQLGTIAYMQGRYGDAVSALQQAVVVDTRQPDSWTLLGLSEFETKDYRNALVHLERGRALGFSGNAAAVRISRYHLALLLIRNREFDRALDVLIPEIAPGALADEIQFAMGTALLRIPALPGEVAAEQQELVRTAGQAAVFLSDSHYEKGLPILQKLVRDHPGTPFLHYAYGDALAATSLYDEAQVQLREETRVNPESPLAYVRLASIELTQHHSALALADAARAVELAPESYEARYLLGRSHLEEGDVAAAIRELETARRLAPNLPKVHFNLARAYAKADRPQEAAQERAEFERLNALLPGQQKSYGDRASKRDD